MAKKLPFESEKLSTPITRGRATIAPHAKMYGWVHPDGSHTVMRKVAERWAESLNKYFEKVGFIA